MWKRAGAGEPAVHFSVLWAGASHAKLDALKKYQTLEQLEKTKAKAARFAENALDDPDLAGDLESESAESYAARKGIVITNKGGKAMANGGSTKTDLQDQLDQVEQILTDAYVPESDRETLATAIGDALNVIEGGDEDDDGDGDDDGDDDQGD